MEVIDNLFITGMNRKARLMIAEATHFFAEQLLGKRLAKHIVLEIELVNKLDVVGECINEDDHKNPRYFTINLKRQKDIEEMIKTLAHEMVHVKQYARNELGKDLIASKNGTFKLSTRWKGEPWSPGRNEDAYYDSPWEIEAYGREVGLYAKYVRWYDEVHGK